MDSGLRSKHQRQWLAFKLRRRTGLHISFECDPAHRLAVCDTEHLVFAHGMCKARCFTAKVVRQVVAFERQQAKLKAQVDEESRRNAGEKERAKRVEIAAWRPDDRLSPAPLLNCWHGYF